MDQDIIVIGGGAAGEAAGFAAAAIGAPAVLVERDLVGGSCPFWACMPSKTLLNSGTMKPPLPSPPKIVDSDLPTRVRSSGDVVVHST